MRQVADVRDACSRCVEWTELAYLQNQPGNSAMWLFGLAVVVRLSWCWRAQY